ncbi:hypothetical protein [Halobacteriovorax sp. HLS]|uniref:hypothetical protein n=1 Tax=Halobacteriovorax sp. HLS TaxID=2234000 RepID=UPI000FDADC25|nr:hypothetical protein [Halobacteriovorax sp. HLS]
MTPTKKIIATAIGISLVSMSTFAQAVSTTSNENKNKDTDVKIGLGLGGVKSDSTLNTASVMGIGVSAYAKYFLTPELHTRLSAGMNFETGSSSSARDNNIYTPSNGNYLKEALVSYSPLELIELEGGVINQSFLDAPMVVDKKGFIAAKEKFQYKVLDTLFSVVATQAIPNNRNLSQRIDVTEEGDPRFYAESLVIDQQLYIGDIKFSLTHFAYDNISNSVAYESILLGNSGTPINKGNGVLANTYSGWNIDLKYAFDISNNYKLELNGNTLKNTAASENNSAYRAGAKLTYASEGNRYSLKIENFSIDADASVAYYNSSRYGMANKEGNRIRFEYKNMPKQINLGAELISNKVINQNVYQSDETVILFSLRKTYDLF